jgi:hypothetical protein
METGRFCWLLLRGLLNTKWLLIAAGLLISGFADQQLHDFMQHNERLMLQGRRPVLILDSGKPSWSIETRGSACLWVLGVKSLRVRACVGVRV